MNGSYFLCNMFWMGLSCLMLVVLVESDSPRTRAQSANESKSQSIQYEYDKAGRLLYAIYAGKYKITYTYDKAGNRIKKTVSDQTTNVENWAIRE